MHNNQYQNVRLAFKIKCSLSLSHVLSSLVGMPHRMAIKLLLIGQQQKERGKQFTIAKTVTRAQKRKTGKEGKKFLASRNRTSDQQITTSFLQSAALPTELSRDNRLDARFNNKPNQVRPRKGGGERKRRVQMGWPAP